MMSKYRQSVVRMSVLATASEWKLVKRYLIPKAHKECGDG